MKRIAVVLSFVLVACGGGDDAGGDDSGDDGSNTPSVASTTGSSAGTTATTSDPGDDGDDDGNGGGDGGFTATGDFCGDADNSEALIDGIDFFSADLEGQVTGWVDAIEAAAAQAPNEIEDDVAVFVGAVNDFANLLADADYVFTDIDQDDARLLALSDGRLDEAAANVAEYCGWDLDDPTAGGGDGDGDGGSGLGPTTVFGALGMTDQPVPDSIPEELIPEVVVAALDGPGGVLIGTTMPIDDVVALYEEVFGPGEGSADNFSFQGPFDGRNWVVGVSEVDAGAILITLIGF